MLNKCLIQDLNIKEGHSLSSSIYTRLGSGIALKSEYSQSSPCPCGVQALLRTDVFSTSLLDLPDLTASNVLSARQCNMYTWSHGPDVSEDKSRKSF